MRLIDADALIPLIQMGECNMYDEYCQGRNGGIEFAVNKVKEMPTIEPERKRGKWIHNNDLKQFFCDQCGEPSLTDDDAYIYSMDFPNFCSNCGAKMEVEHEGHDI